MAVAALAATLAQEVQKILLVHRGAIQLQDEIFHCRESTRPLWDESVLLLTVLKVEITEVRVNGRGASYRGGRGHTCRIDVSCKKSRVRQVRAQRLQIHGVESLVRSIPRNVRQCGHSLIEGVQTLVSVNAIAKAAAIQVDRIRRADGKGGEAECVHSLLGEPKEPAFCGELRACLGSISYVLRFLFRDRPSAC